MLPGLHSKYPRQTQRQDGPFFQHQCPVPKTSSSDAIVQAARDLTYALMHPATATPFAKIGANQLDAIQHLATIFDRAVPTPLSTPASSPRVTIVAPTAPVPDPLTMAPASAPSVTLGHPLAPFSLPLQCRISSCPTRTKYWTPASHRANNSGPIVPFPLLSSATPISLPLRSRPNPRLPLPFQVPDPGM